MIKIIRNARSDVVLYGLDLEQFLHTVFNAGLGVAWEQDRSELRLFEGVDFWVSPVTAAGFSDSKQRLLQANDPSLKTLMCFFKS